MENFEGISVHKVLSGGSESDLFYDSHGRLGAGCVVAGHFPPERYRLGCERLYRVLVGLHDSYPIPENLRIGVGYCAGQQASDQVAALRFLRRRAKMRTRLIIERHRERAARFVQIQRARYLGYELPHKGRA